MPYVADSTITSPGKDRCAPLGPYTARGNINRYGPFRESQLGFIIVPGQQTFVAQVRCD